MCQSAFGLYGVYLVPRFVDAWEQVSPSPRHGLLPSWYVVICYPDRYVYCVGGQADCLEFVQTAIAPHAPPAERGRPQLINVI